MKQQAIRLGDILRDKRNPKLRVKVLRIWQPTNFPSETFISVQTIKTNNEPDKRYWEAWSGGNVSNWEKETND